MRGSIPCGGSIFSGVPFCGLRAGTRTGLLNLSSLGSIPRQTTNKRSPVESGTGPPKAGCGCSIHPGRPITRGWPNWQRRRSQTPVVPSSTLGPRTNTASIAQWQSCRLLTGRPRFDSSWGHHLPASYSGYYTALVTRERLFDSACRHQERSICPSSLPIGLWPSEDRCLD
jgi:hypothetical protein